MKNIPFVTTYYENIDDKKVVRKIRSIFSNIQSGHLSEVFKKEYVFLSQKQPENLLQLLTLARFNTEINGLFKCVDKCCKVCSPHIFEGHSFIMSNIRIMITCYLQINQYN